VSHDRLYRVTSIGRPLEPSYRTNLAVLLLMPLAAVIAAAVAAVGGSGVAAIVGRAVGGGAVVFGAWALARELAPDDNPAAFISMALGYVTFLVVAAPSLLLLFTALLLARVVNRTVGPPARLTDSLLVLGLTLWAAWSIRSPVLPVVASVAFALDAFLENGNRRQLLFAGLALIGALVMALQFGSASEGREVSLVAGVLVALVSVGFGIAIARTRRVRSVADVTGNQLSVARVRAGMFVGILVAAQALVLGADGVEASALIWATLAGVAVGGWRAYG
jgi:hypothetical protein